MNDTPARVCWHIWVLCEVALVLSSIASCMIYLLLRSLKFDIADHDYDTKEMVDIIERESISIETFSIFIVPGLMGIAIAFLQLNTVATGELFNITIASSSILCFAGLSIAVFTIARNGFYNSGCSSIRLAKLMNGSIRL